MRAYLDHNATSPLRPEARAALHQAADDPAGNASSTHAEGRAARARVERAREEVAGLLQVPAREIVFTSGASEGIAAAVFGVAGRADAAHTRIVVSAVEHSAVLESARALTRRGFDVVEISCSASGRVDPEVFVSAIDGKTALAALQLANNETGVIQPVWDVGAACAEAGTPFLVDAVQAAGRVPIDRDGWNAALLVVSGHKLGGPQGTGALVVRDGLRMTPLVPGGGQERRRRGGTEPVAALAGFGAACGAALSHLLGEQSRLAQLRDGLERSLTAIAPDIKIHGADAPRLPNTSCVTFPGATGETLVIALDLAGIAVATGSACASGAIEPSHVLLAMGLPAGEARGAVRFSLGWSSTQADVDRLLSALPEILARARMAAR